jgi:hypothetical protein
VDSLERRRLCLETQLGLLDKILASIEMHGGRIACQYMLCSDVKVRDVHCLNAMCRSAYQCDHYITVDLQEVETSDIRYEQSGKCKKRMKGSLAPSICVHRWNY